MLALLTHQDMGQTFLFKHFFVDWDLDGKINPVVSGEQNSDLMKNSTLIVILDNYAPSDVQDKTTKCGNFFEIS